jgi:ABC-type transport system involved in cytochrome c biogenesis permease subunit
MNLLEISNAAFVTALLVYSLSFLIFVLAVAGRKWSNREPEKHVRRWSAAGYAVSLIGLAAHLIYFVTRWIGGGHIPTSNMFEFMAFLALMVAAAFHVIYWIYRTPFLGIFATPVAVVIMGYASVFPRVVQPLVPSLNSIWLKLHVTLAATGEAFFAVGFAAGLMQLLRTVDFHSRAKAALRGRRSIEFTLFVVLCVIGFIGSFFAFNASGYHAEFSQQIVEKNNAGVETTKTEQVDYIFPPIVQPHNSEIISVQPFLGLDKPLFAAPSWMEGVNAGRKLNTVIWSILAGIVLYSLIRLVLRKPIGSAIHPILHDIDPDDLDEISYRAIAIGFPIFTLGALVFAMIWAHYAWGRFWGWDPKEVWALITWLFYSAYLHLRLSRNWMGVKSSWMSVIGFLIVMFTLIGVNLIISGLHSYAGVQ